MKKFSWRDRLGALLMAAVLVVAFIMPVLPAKAETEGDLWIWGFGRYGQLGFGTNNTSAQATQLESIGTITSTSGGCYHSLALKSDGTVWAWGYNGFGQLGIGSDTDVNTPTQVTGISDVIAIAGGCYHSVAVKADGTVWTWGNNGTWNLGIGSPAPDACRGFASSGTGASCSKVPIQANNLTNIKSVAAGITLDVALANDGTVWHWGDFNQGNPAQVAGISDVTSIAAGSYHILATKSDGTVWAWGSGSFDNVPGGITTWVPQQVTGLTDATMVAAGGWHSLAVKADGTAWAWGRNNYGQVGMGSLSPSVSSPTQVLNLTDIQMVAGSLFSSFALKDDGTMHVWGYGYDGEYGDGSFLAPRATPLQVNSLSNVTYITAGAYHVMAIVQNNQPPVVDAGGPYSVVEGGSVTVAAAGSDPDGDTLTYAWDRDNNGTFETAGQSVTFDAALLAAPSTQTIRVQVTDTSGSTATDEATVSVVYDFAGFFDPVENPPILNVVNAGRSIPIKFSLNGYQGMDIFEAGYPASQQIACDTSLPTSVIETTDTAGTSGLNYDADIDQYNYIWQTAKEWEGTCRQLTVKLVDGTVHQALFKFR